MEPSPAEPAVGRSAALAWSVLGAAAAGHALFCCAAGAGGPAVRRRAWLLVSSATCAFSVLTLFQRAERLLGAAVRGRDLSAARQLSMAYFVVVVLYLGMQWAAAALAGACGCAGCPAADDDTWVVADSSRTDCGFRLRAEAAPVDAAAEPGGRRAEKSVALFGREEVFVQRSGGVLLEARARRVSCCAAALGTALAFASSDACGRLLRADGVPQNVPVQLLIIFGHHGSLGGLLLLGGLWRWVGIGEQGDRGEGKEEAEPGARLRLCDRCVQAAEARSWALSLALLLCRQVSPGAGDDPAGLPWLGAAVAASLHLAVAACRQGPERLEGLASLALLLDHAADGLGLATGCAWAAAFGRSAATAAGAPGLETCLAVTASVAAFVVWSRFVIGKLPVVKDAGPASERRLLAELAARSPRRLGPEPPGPAGMTWRSAFGWT